jgi:large subunit ribosomal protein L10
VDRGAKEALVTALNASLVDAGLVIVTRQNGMTVAETTKLRRQMRDAGASFKVAKNRLARLALKGTRYEALGEQLTGPTGLAYSSDPVTAAKVAVKFSKENQKLTIVAGAMAGQMLNPEGVKALAELPSLDTLRGKIVGLLQAPASKIAAVLQAPAGQLARVLKAYSEKSQASEAA